MSREEFLDKYGDAVVTFSSYYKYVFYYEGELPDGNKIRVGCGGTSDEIYQHEVSVTSLETVASLYPFWGKVTSPWEVVDSFYDY